jgi:hypothetical protein
MEWYHPTSLKEIKFKATLSAREAMITVSGEGRGRVIMQKG